MHYEDLIIAHKAFIKPERRSYNFDEYLTKKNLVKWKNPILPIEEITILFDFVKRWDFHFKGDPLIFKKRYEEIFFVLETLKQKKVETASCTLLSGILRATIHSCPEYFLHFLAS